MDETFRLMMSILQGSRKKTYLTAELKEIKEERRFKKKKKRVKRWPNNSNMNDKLLSLKQDINVCLSCRELELSSLG